MRLIEVSVTDSPPIRAFDVKDISDVIVLAGPNGVGKTRLVRRLIQAFTDLGTPGGVRMVIEATNSLELAAR